MFSIFCCLSIQQFHSETFFWTRLASCEFHDKLVYFLYLDLAEGKMWEKLAYVEDSTLRKSRENEWNVAGMLNVFEKLFGRLSKSSSEPIKTRINYQLRLLASDAEPDIPKKHFSSVARFLHEIFSRSESVSQIYWPRFQLDPLKLKFTGGCLERCNKTFSFKFHLAFLCQRIYQNCYWYLLPPIEFCEKQFRIFQHK